MSQENVDMVREAVDAVNGGDPDAFIACLHSDVEWEESGDVLPGLRGFHRGSGRGAKVVRGSSPGTLGERPYEIEEITEGSDGCIVV